jgi:hypothetical protein
MPVYVYLEAFFNVSLIFVISGFHLEAEETCAVQDITQGRVVIPYRRFGKTYRSHF